MASNLQVFLLGVPVMVIVGNDPSTSFFVRSAIIFLNDFAVLGFIIGGLIFSYYTKGNKVAPPSNNTFAIHSTHAKCSPAVTQVHNGHCMSTPAVQVEINPT